MISGGIFLFFPTHHWLARTGLWNRHWRMLYAVYAVFKNHPDEGSSADTRLCKYWIWTCTL